MTVDGAAIVQMLMGAAVLGLVGDHFRLRKELAALEKSALNGEFRREVMAKFDVLQTTLQQLSTDLAFIKGQQAAQHGEG